MRIFETLRKIKNQLFCFRKKKAALYPNSARFNSGTLIIGQPGMGKSKLIESLVLQDIRAGRAGVGMIDIHGDLFRELTWYLAAMVARFPELARRVVIIDPTSDWTVSFNPLGAIAGVPQERLAMFLTDVVISIWRVDTTQSPRMVWLLMNTLVAMADLGLNLLDLPRWLQDAKWRNNLLPRIHHEAVRNFFKYEFPKSDKEVRVWIAPLLNKMGGLIFDPDIRPMLSGRSKLNFREVLDRGLILLVHLPKGILGEANSALLAAFIVAQLQKAAMARADSPYRRSFILYLDEFQNYTSPHIQDILSESRKWGLGVVLAHQFLEQLSPEMRSAVISTTKTIISFRVGYRDARTLVPDIFPYPDFLAIEGLSGWEDLALELANLPPRHFWIRRRGVYVPDKKRTLDMPDPLLTPGIEANLARLREISGRRYGRRKSHVVRDRADTEGPRPESLVASQPLPQRGRQQPEPLVNFAVQSAIVESDGRSGTQPNHLLKGGDGKGDLDELWN